MIKPLLSILLSVFSIPSFAQEGNKDIPFRMSVRAAATVPHALTNKAFRRSFTGIYNIQVNYNYQVFHGFQIGIEYEHGLWKTADNKIPGINTYAQAHHGGIRVGYDRVVGENAVAFVGLSFREGTMKFYGLSFADGTDLSDLQTKYTYNTLGTDVGVFFYTEGSFAIGIHLAADFTNYNFDPYKLYLNQHKAYIASDIVGKFSQINAGFSVVYSFFKK